MKILNAIKKCWCIEQITQTFDLLDTGVLNLQILTLFFLQNCQPLGLVCLSGLIQIGQSFFLYT